jgi:hypothetical protein
LAWRNNISVTPGESYTVVVGAGGIHVTGQNNNDAARNGGASYFIGLPSAGNNTTVYPGVSATGAQGDFAGKPIFDSTAIEGNLAAVLGTRGVNWNGGFGGLGGQLINTDFQPGGGGAGGYSAGSSGNGGGGSADTPGTTGDDNGGGGGGAGQISGGNGGGVGLYGQGPTGQGGQVAGAKNGKGGFGSLVNGAVDTDTDGFADPPATGGGGRMFNSGGVGGVRIIWGPGRAYPDTLTGDV